MMSEQKKASFRDYIASNAIPIMVEAVFALSCLIVPSSYLIYTNCFILLFCSWFVFSSPKTLT